MDETVVIEAWGILVSGGPIMVPLAVLSLLLYGNIIRLFFFVRNVQLVDPTAEKEYMANLEATSDSPTADEVQAGIRWFFDEVSRQFRRLVQDRLRYTGALVAAAPLLGLLGTVMGMLDTFQSLSIQAGFDTQEAVADGVSRALITTQTGLMIAIPALFIIHWVRRVTNQREQVLMEQKIQFLSTRKGEVEEC